MSSRSRPKSSKQSQPHSYRTALNSPRKFNNILGTTKHGASKLREQLREKNERRMTTMEDEDGTQLYVWGSKNTL